MELSIHHRADAFVLIATALLCFCNTRFSAQRLRLETKPEFGKALKPSKAFDKALGLT
jgi:hypothetical protein